MNTTPHHYYISSCGFWDVSTDLEALHRRAASWMTPYSMWSVPCSIDTPYRIYCYAPDVEGAQHLGVFGSED